MMRTPSPSRGERGNILVILLIIIVLMAALYLAVGRGMRNSSTNTVSDEKSALLADELLSHGLSVKTAIQQIMLRNECADTQISFENNKVLLYTNPNAPGTKLCHVFDPAGGGLNWKSPPVEANPNNYDYRYTSAGRIIGVGIDTRDELTIQLRGIPINVCTRLNEKAGISGIPVDAGGIGGSSFVGTYGVGATYDGIDSKQFGCIEATGGSAPGRYFFYVILAR